MKSVFITGANRGLGRGFVEYFLSQNYLVFAGTRNPSTFDPKLYKNPNLTIIKIDVTSDDSILAAYFEISKKTDKLIYLINNAGLNKDSATDNHKELVCSLNNLNREALLKIFDVNTIAPLMMAKIFMPLLKGDSSFVINISSARGSYNDENANTSANYGYRASKTALNMMTFCSLFDLPPNVKTFSVHPGGVKTDMNPTGTDLPTVQAEKIIGITKNWKEEFNGRFMRYDGTLYP
jgi:NAD(P)-dependent dehydrogenase (short-subunit alcohol dehydrogenase family)